MKVTCAINEWQTAPNFHVSGTTCIYFYPMYHNRSYDSCFIVEYHFSKNIYMNIYHDDFFSHIFFVQFTARIVSLLRQVVF